MDESRIDKLEVPDRTTVAVPQEERSLSALLASDLNSVVTGTISGVAAAIATARLIGGNDKDGGTPPAPPPPGNPSELHSRPEQA